MARVSVFLIAVILIAGMAGCVARHPIEIRDWYDLDAIRDHLGGSYILMNDLDSTTAGYEELASPTAHHGRGWDPIVIFVLTHGYYGFEGAFDGQGYEIRDLFINRPGEDHVGLFGDVGGVIMNTGVVNVTATGTNYVGGLVGDNYGTVSNSYSTGSVTGNDYVGGLVGINGGPVSNSYSTGSVTGNENVGGLVGWNFGSVSNSYSTGSVTGNENVGGLVGQNWETVSNSYYNYDEVLINGENIITIGALFDEDFEEWLANDKFLDVNERLSQEDGYYMINNVSDFQQLLAFGQDDSLRFRLKDDLDLGTETNFYIPYLAGEFDGNGHKISNLSFNLDFVYNVGLFGYLAPGGKVSQVGVENVNITGMLFVGGLVGKNTGTVSNSYFTGSVTGHYMVGGLVGGNGGTVSNSYSIGNVSGNISVGGLVGGGSSDTVSNSFWDTETSGQATSAGGTGKTTAQMKDIATFSAWDIIAVTSGQTNPAYTWNIVDGQTYPFLSWEP